MNRTLKLLSLLSIAGILTLCFFSWFSGDDLCYRNELSRYTVFEKAWLQYLYWDGRSLGIASIIQLTGLKYLSAPVITFIWALSFIGMAIMILKIVMLKTPDGQSKKNSLTSIALLVTIMWLGMWKLIPDIIYWPTGGWYCMMSLLGLLWIYIFSMGIQAKKFTTRKILLIFLVSLICGNNSHNIIVPLIFLALVEGAHAVVIRKDRKEIIYISSAIAGLIISGIFVMGAPGNFERLKAISWHGFNSSFLNFFLIVFAKYCYWLLALFIFYPILRFLNGQDLFPPAGSVFSIKKLKEAAKNKESVVTALYNHKYLLASFSTVIVFSATSFFAVPRTAIFFAVFLIIYAIQKSKLSFHRNASKRFMYGTSLFLLLFNIVLILQILKASSLEKEMKMRVEEYHLNPGKDILVNAIPLSNIPFAFMFVDISPDSTYWVNRCVATNFNLKTVRTLQK